MPTNLERAMIAETTLNDYHENKEGIPLDCSSQDGEETIVDLISDLCHLLHLDEKTAGCKTIEEVRGILRMAFEHFEAETIGEPS